MRTLAIDLGARRIGLALSDAGGRLATPYDVVPGPPSRAMDEILNVIEAEDVQRIVVGLPLNMDGTRGPAANEAVEFGRRLSARSGKNAHLRR